MFQPYGFQIPRQILIAFATNDRMRDSTATTAAIVAYMVRAVVSGSALGCRSIGHAIGPASGAGFSPKKDLIRA